MEIISYYFYKFLFRSSIVNIWWYYSLIVCCTSLCIFLFPLCLLAFLFYSSISLFTVSLSSVLCVCSTNYQCFLCVYVSVSVVSLVMPILVVVNLLVLMSVSIILFNNMEFPPLFIAIIGSYWRFGEFHCWIEVCKYHGMFSVYFSQTISNFIYSSSSSPSPSPSLSFSWMYMYVMSIVKKFCEGSFIVW